MTLFQFGRKVIISSLILLVSGIGIGTQALADLTQSRLDDVNTIRGNAGVSAQGGASSVPTFGIGAERRHDTIYESYRMAGDIGWAGNTLVGGVYGRIGRIYDGLHEQLPGAIGHLSFRANPITSQMLTGGGVEIPLEKSTRLTLIGFVPLLGNVIISRTTGTSSIGLAAGRVGIEKIWGETMILEAYVDGSLAISAGGGHEPNKGHQEGFGVIGNAGIDFKYFPIGQNYFVGANASVSGRRAKVEIGAPGESRHTENDIATTGSLMVTAGAAF